MQGTTGKWERCKWSLQSNKDIKSSIPYHKKNSIQGYRSLIFRSLHKLNNFLTSVCLISLMVCKLFSHGVFGEQRWSRHANALRWNSRLDKISQLFHNWEMEAMDDTWSSRWVYIHTIFFCLFFLFVGFFASYVIIICLSNPFYLQIHYDLC